MKAADWLICLRCHKYFDPVSGKIVESWKNAKHLETNDVFCEACMKEEEEEDRARWP